jgi:hypothetical protein
MVRPEEVRHIVSGAGEWKKIKIKNKRGKVDKDMPSADLRVS